jgi:hypothetical protein
MSWGNPLMKYIRHLLRTAFTKIRSTRKPKVKERDHWENIDVEGRIFLECT